MISDWDCLDRARRGDEDAWQLLFERHHLGLIKIAVLITGSLEAAKDLAQESFVRLLQSRVKHTDGSFKSYLSTIAYRLALKEKKRSSREKDFEGSDMPDGNPSPLEKTVREERDRHLVRTIRALPEHHRDILILRFYGEHSYEEIARLTRLPLGTVKSRIFYAVKMCGAELRERGVI
jgi:RNA polymerase sigma-70 factor (ECF subfamily)